MRITLEKLVDLARSEAQRRGTFEDVISAYGIGTVASGDPVFGGTADVDLILIHENRPGRRREIVPLSAEVHLDITHHSTAMYARPRRLRTQPWLGSSMCEPLFLYDPDHFFEWAQASVRGQFHRADHVYARASNFLARARRLKADLDASSDTWLTCYLQTTLEGANAAACIAGFPAGGRRLALTLESRLKSLNLSERFSDFNFLIGADQIDGWSIAEQLSAWAQTFDAAAELDAKPELHPVRRDYYLQAFQTLIDQERAQAILWPLLRTWSLAASEVEATGRHLPKEDVWQATLQQMRLAPAHRSGRELALEAFLDHIEEFVERWNAGLVD